MYVGNLESAERDSFCLSVKRLIWPQFFQIQIFLARQDFSSPDFYLQVSVGASRRASIIGRAAKQSKTKQRKAKQSKTKQSNAKQSITNQSS